MQPSELFLNRYDALVKNRFISGPADLEEKTGISRSLVDGLLAGDETAVFECKANDMLGIGFVRRSDERFKNLVVELIVSQLQQAFQTASVVHKGYGSYWVEVEAEWICLSLESFQEIGVQIKSLVLFAVHEEGKNVFIVYATIS